MSICLLSFYGFDEGAVWASACFRCCTGVFLLLLPHCLCGHILSKMVQGSDDLQLVLQWVVGVLYIGETEEQLYNCMAQLRDVNKGLQCTHFGTRRVNNKQRKCSMTSLISHLQCGSPLPIKWSHAEDSNPLSVSIYCSNLLRILGHS